VAGHDEFDRHESLGVSHTACTAEDSEYLHDDGCNYKDLNNLKDWD
jgi:hypothetical protein